MSLRSFSFRVFAVGCVLATVASCGGGSGSSDDGMTNTESAETTSMDELVTAIESLDYTCSPESVVLTSAERQLCLTTSSVSLSAYVWDDEDAFAAEVDTELSCTTESGFGELRSLRGDTWAISSYSVSGATMDYDAEINGLLTSLQEDLGGTTVSTPCA